MIAGRVSARANDEDACDPSARPGASKLAAAVIVALFVAGTFGSQTLGSGSSRATTFMVGVDEDGAKWGGGARTATIVRALGMDAIRVTVPWRDGRVRLSAADRVALDAALRSAAGLRVVVSVFGRADETPTTTASRSAYCGYVADLLDSYPAVSDVVIWNEVSDSAFWRPQFGSSGASRAPADYEALLARCWSVLHAERRDVNVITSTAPHGNDSPRARVPSHSPGRFYRLLGAAYRASGRTQPIFDTIGHNPYPEFAAERPWTPHTSSRSIGQGDYDRLMSALREGFGQTAQPLPGTGPVTIWYLEQGFQTAVAPEKAHLYSGKETDGTVLAPWSASADDGQGPATDQESQLVDAIRLAYCQENVGAYFNFGLADERDLRGWQSGLLWADWTAKPAFRSVMRVVEEIRNDAVDCASVNERGYADALPEDGDPGDPSDDEDLVSDLRTLARSPFGATVAWHTGMPSSSRVAWGLRGEQPTVWSDAGEPGFEHRASLSGLAADTAYRVWVRVAAPDGRYVERTLDVTTPRLSARTGSSLTRSPPALLVDGAPFFPLMVWGACTHDFEANLVAGINLFARNGCGTLDELIAKVGGRAFTAAVAGTEDDAAAGAQAHLLGFFYPDEADGLGMTGATLPPRPAALTDDVSLLTLTNHFYSGSAPLFSGGRSYPGLIAATDVVGFDLYPLQESCRPSRLGEVFDAQQELARMAPRKPTFQWIESAEMKCHDAASKVTPETVRAESWLAIAGDARGLGFFPASWSPAIGSAIASVSRDVAALGPALLGAPVHVRWEPSDPVRVGARYLRGATYVIAVNATRTPVRATIRVTGLGEKPLEVLDERRDVTAVDGSFTDTFGPLAVHIYIAAPSE